MSEDRLYKSGVAKSNDYVISVCHVPLVAEITSGQIKEIHKTFKTRKREELDRNSMETKKQLGSAH